MSRVIFENQRPTLEVDPGRADVACFVGLAKPLDGVAISTTVQTWLKSLGYTQDSIDQKLNIPIPIETYSGFTALFDDGSAAANTNFVNATTNTNTGTNYLAAAVRSFFAQGGKRCYVVRVGDPLDLNEDPKLKQAALTALLPDDTYAPEDRRSWSGVGALNALSDVSFLAVPDLPFLVASLPVPAAGPDPAPATGPEQFVDCSQRGITLQDQHPPAFAAPRLTMKDYDDWASAVATIINYLASGSIRHELQLREVQFVAAFPLPQDLDITSALENSSNAAPLAQDIQDVIQKHMPKVETFGNYDKTNLSSAFLQLAYPWLKTTGSYSLLEQLEPPDGALVGILARNALTRGTFTSATKITPAEIYDISPSLPSQETTVPATPLNWQDGSTIPLICRLSLFGFTPGGLQLLSDVTAFPGESYRSACVNRLVSVICRASRRLGQEIIFEMNGPALWGRVEAFLKQLMTRLWTLNALDGASATDSFTVRCDSSTMTQNDLDQGRLVAEVTFTAASTIELIHVTLALETSGTSAQEVNALLEAV